MQSSLANKKIHAQLQTFRKLFLLLLLLLLFQYFLLKTSALILVIPNFSYLLMI
jgi:hypothetical protein